MNFTKPFLYTWSSLEAIFFLKMEQFWLLKILILEWWIRGWSTFKTRNMCTYIGQPLSTCRYVRTCLYRLFKSMCTYIHVRKRKHISTIRGYIAAGTCMHVPRYLCTYMEPVPHLLSLPQYVSIYQLKPHLALKFLHSIKNLRLFKNIV